MKGTTWLARALGACCAALLALALILFYANDFTTMMTFNRPEAGYRFAFVDGLVSATFPQAGPSSAYLLVVNLVLAATFTPVGVLIASRKPNNSLGWLFLATGFSTGVLVVTDQYAAHALLSETGLLSVGAAAEWVASWVWLPPIAFVVTLLPLLFPAGRPPNRRWWVVVWLTVLGQAMIIVYLAFVAGAFNEDMPQLENPLGASGAANVLEICLGAGLVISWSCFLAAVVSLILRLRRSRGRERQQIKWFAYAVTMAALALISGTLVRGALSADVPGTILQFAALPLLPVAIAVAILRHRLYDIDLVINRTLVYALLTASLVLVYAGSVVGLQFVFRVVTGQETQLAVVASTLLIAALFNPIRHRIQAFIDRRFFRQKYDAAKTLEAFGASLREEVDLESLKGELVAVVEQTMRPARVSLWLRDARAGTNEKENTGMQGDR